MRYLINILLSLIVAIFVLGCVKEHNDSDSRHQEDSVLSHQKDSVDSFLQLVKLALEKGDTVAYNHLHFDFLESPYTGFLRTALIMANKYNYPPAYFDVYACLTDIFHKKDFAELDDLDVETRRLALKYLVAGANKGDEECRTLLKQKMEDGKYVDDLLH